VSEIADFLRARYEEAKQREQGKLRRIPSAFDGHNVEIACTLGGEQTLLVDGHPYPIETYRKVATEPAPDPGVIADLDAKLAIVKHMKEMLEFAEGDTEIDHYGALDAAELTLRLLAQPFAGHPDHKREEWVP
jgi:hypothetical protein